MNENIITEYIMTSPAKAHEHLWAIYNILEEVIGDNTTKVLSYQMPTYKAKRNVIHFNASTTHIGIYPGPEAIAEFKSQFAMYDYSKGTLRIKYNQQVPTELIKQLAQYSYELNKE